jgi:hypothetical protein
MNFDLSWNQGVAEVAGATDRAASWVAGGRARLRRLAQGLAPGVLELHRLSEGGGRAVAPRSWPADRRGAEVGAAVDTRLLRDLRGIDLRLAALGFEPKSGLRS